MGISSDRIMPCIMNVTDQVVRSRGKNNLFRCSYVLPDGIEHMKGFVKDLDQAKRYLSLPDGVPVPLQTKEEVGHPELTEKPEDRKRIDLTKNEFDLTNERFLVPEMIFRPADLGMNQAGLAECIVRAVNSCHPHLHPVLYESIILTGGSTLFPRFAERLERDLRPLIPDDYQVKITSQEDPILGIWRGGSLLASSPDFESTCVTKSEYEELGSARCRRREFSQVPVVISLCRQGSYVDSNLPIFGCAEAEAKLVINPKIRKGGLEHFGEELFQEGQFIHHHLVMQAEVATTSDSATFNLADISRILLVRTLLYSGLASRVPSTLSGFMKSKDEASEST
ncbi:Actin-related protein [Macleaya cordata]|uniref:Actin-related protein n=1 Tax=Macleaya cordata TaxID=56857 RepID=A0A200QTS5_MACCD|nr:Actin-related protein [Macleaya cordata]